MSTIEKLRKDKMLAMKNKDKVKSGVISLIMSNILLEQKEKKRDLTDEEQLAFVKKELKQTMDTLEQTPQDRVEAIEETKQKIEIINTSENKNKTQELTEDFISIVKNFCGRLYGANRKKKTREIIETIKD